MPRRKKRAGRPPTPPHEAFVFEIKSWEPTYSFSVNVGLERDEAYSEFAELHLETVCLEPKRVAGRSASVLLSGRHNYVRPPRLDREPHWRPESIGLLHLRPSGGGFYGGVPHETLPFLVSGLRHQQFRYMMLLGEPLTHGKSIVTTLNFMSSTD